MLAITSAPISPTNRAMDIVQLPNATRMRVPPGITGYLTNAVAQSVGRSGEGATAPEPAASEPEQRRALPEDGGTATPVLPPLSC